MSEDVEHLWRLVGATLDEGATTDYVCELCPAVLAVLPGEDHPPLA